MTNLQNRTIQSNRIFLVVPKIIEQPTWGGDYILNYKEWAEREGLTKIKIGQSYELFSGSKLNTVATSSADKSFTGEMGYAMEPDVVKYEGDPSDLISVQELIDNDPKGVLGSTALNKHGKTIQILIKFTQAMGNSFQMHAKENDASDKWLAKPESWYYFEPGLLTLGIKDSTCWEPYERTCREIDQKLKELVIEISNDNKSISQAKEEIKSFIKKLDPWQYVNVVNVSKDEIIDLSEGGLHHSWEEDVVRHPLGNIVYELCLDVMDPVSSIRSFDKGKIKDDGTIRDVHIDSYFKLIDRSTETNDPANHKIKPKVLFEDTNIRIESLLRSKTYCLDKLILQTDYSGDHTKLSGTYHHLFMKEGEAIISSEESNIKLTKGHSCFVPAGVGEYMIKPISQEKCEILKTFVE